MSPLRALNKDLHLKVLFFFFQGTTERKSALCLPPDTVPTQSGSAAPAPHGALASHLVVAARTSARGGPPPKSVWPERGARPPALSLSPASRRPLGSSVSWLWPGSRWERRAEGSGRSWGRVWERRAREERASPGEASFPATPLPIVDPLGGGRGALHTPAGPQKGKAWAEGTEPGGAPGEDDRLPMGTGLQGLLQAGILQARNNRLRAAAQLPGA